MSKKSIGLVLLLILVLGLGVGGYFIFKGDDSDDVDTSNKNTSIDTTKDDTSDQVSQNNIEPIDPEFPNFSFVVPEGWEITKKEYVTSEYTGLTSFEIVVEDIDSNAVLNYSIYQTDAEKEPFCIKSGDTAGNFASSGSNVFNSFEDLGGNWQKARVLDDGAIDRYFYTKSFLSSEDEGFDSILEKHNAGIPLEVRTAQEYCGYKIKIGEGYYFDDYIEDSQGDLRLLDIDLFRKGDLSYIKGETVNFMDENTVKEADEIVESTTGVVN